MKRVTTFLVFSLVLTSFYAQTADEKNPILIDDLIIEAGLFFPSENVDLSVKGSTDIGIEEIEDIDFDETLGLSGVQTTFNLHFKWRFSKSNLWSMSGEYFRLSTKESITLDEEIEWEGVVYPVGGEARLGYSLSLYRIFFGRVISRGQKHEFGAGLGIHGLNTLGFIEGEAFADGQKTGFERSEARAFLPLPNIGASYTWAPTTKWAFMARVDWFGVKIKNVSGGLWNVSPVVTYLFSKNFGASASYQFINFSAGLDQDNWNGGFDIGFEGPSVRLMAHF